MDYLHIFKRKITEGFKNTELIAKENLLITTEKGT